MENGIVRFVREFIDENGYSPSIREICEGTNISSTSTVWSRLHMLRAQGDLDFKDGKARTIHVRDRARS